MKIQKDQLYYILETANDVISELVTFLINIHDLTHLVVVDLEKNKIVDHAILECEFNTASITKELGKRNLSVFSLTEVDNKILEQDVMRMISTMTMDNVIDMVLEGKRETVLVRVRRNHIICDGHTYIALKKKNQHKDLLSNAILYTITKYSSQTMDYYITIYDTQSDNINNMIYIVGKEMRAAQALKILRKMGADVDSIYYVEDNESEILLLAMISKAHVIKEPTGIIHVELSFF